MVTKRPSPLAGSSSEGSAPVLGSLLESWRRLCARDGSIFSAVAQLVAG